MEDFGRSPVVAAVMDASVETIRNQMVALLPRLRRFALSLAGNRTDADDLVQDTIERALRRLDQWQEGTRLDSWMFRIAQNLWIDALRARRVRNLVDADPDAAPGASHDGVRDAEAKLTFAATVRAMQDLPDDQRVAVALVLVDGMSYREASDILQVPIGTLTSRLGRARMALAERIYGAETSGDAP